VKVRTRRSRCRDISLACRDAMALELRMGVVDG
jgi:hypothetical protein